MCLEDFKNLLLVTHDAVCNTWVGRVLQLHLLVRILKVLSIWRIVFFFLIIFKLLVHWKQQWRMPYILQFSVVETFKMRFHCNFLSYYKISFFLSVPYFYPYLQELPNPIHPSQTWIPSLVLPFHVVQLPGHAINLPKHAVGWEHCFLKKQQGHALKLLCEVFIPNGNIGNIIRKWWNWNYCFH